MPSAYESLIGSIGAPGGKTIYAGNYNVRKTGPMYSGLLKNLKPDPMGMTILAGEAKAPGQLGPSNIKNRNKNKSRKNRNKNKSRKNRNKNKSRKNRNKNKSRKNRNRK